MQYKKQIIFLFILALSSIWFFNSPGYSHLRSQISEIREEIQLYRNIAKLKELPPDQSLLMPVEGVSVSQVADTWGAPRPNDRLHEGQDIFAAKGTPVRSATFGYVVRITDQVLGGKSVFVIGAGGRRYFYTHLDSFAEGLQEGQEVTTNTILGFVGNTGNAATTPPHLHFGVYENGEAINPLPFLKEGI
jgi:peptidoglycan LD-endopeptidase LytH